MQRIDYWHVREPYLGSRRLAVKLQGEGYNAGRKVVRRLMRLMGITAIYPKPNLSKRNFKAAIA